MRSIRILRFSLAIAAVVAGCADDVSGHAGLAPAIHSLTCSPASVAAAQDEVRIDVSFSFTDPDADFGGYQGWIAQPGREGVESGGNTDQVDTGVTEGNVRAHLIVTGLASASDVIGTWRWEVIGVDDAGNQSNKLGCEFIVY